MFNYIKGLVTNIIDSSITLESNNIGYNISIYNESNFVLNKEYKVYIIDLIKENSEIILYGFLTLEECLMFKKLINVNGVGPKTAQNILKYTPINTLIYMIKTKDVKSLSKINNVGLKAQNIVFELSNKLNEFNLTIFEYKNVYDALKSLGFPNDIILNAITKLDPSLDDEKALKEALRIIKNGE